MELPFTLDLKSETALYKQLSDRLKEAISQLKLMPGQMMPSTRELADQLHISRATVLKSYDELLSQGYLKTVDGIGTFVSQDAPGTRTPVPAQQQLASLRLSNYANSILTLSPKAGTQADFKELNYGAAPPDLLPLKQWRQNLLRRLRDLNLTDIEYSTEVFGFRPLREALAEYLMRARALQCTADQILVFSGPLHPHDLVTRLLLNPGDTACVENPGFPFARHVLTSHGVNLTPIPVDENGIRVEIIENSGTPPQLVYVTPSHQDPTGALMSLDRRRRLLHYAFKNRIAIIEDDYDCEFRYSGAQLPALHGLDERGLVFYISSFWKTLFPIVNVGILVIPESMIELFTRAQSLTETNVSTDFPLLEQFALMDLITEGHYERHLRKILQVYAKRRQALIFALNKHLRELLIIPKESAGMHMIVRFKSNLEDAQLAELARECGLPAVSTAHYYMQDPVRGEFIIPFGHVTEAKIHESVEKLSVALKANA